MTPLSQQMRAFLDQGVSTDAMMPADFDVWVSGWLPEVEQLEAEKERLGRVLEIVERLVSAIRPDQDDPESWQDLNAILDTLHAMGKQDAPRFQRIYKP